ncbi:cation/calcium exchanger 3-like [Diospyros lotus]|uniref:cation/calcium exchanger 3-like n=1 Tax=Diospyros lotus TaxID=55363 RepID=UPI0022529B28|nr:cation/calcium exchanger 3-like [Diospyros lotus]
MEDLKGFYRRRRSSFRGIANGISALLLFLFCFREANPSLWGSPPFKLASLRSNQIDGVVAVHNRRRIAETHVALSSSPDYSSTGNGRGGSVQNNLSSTMRTPTSCAGLHKHKGYKSRCDYLIANPQCGSGGFFNYLVFFYCDCEKTSVVAYVVLAIWLVALFYLLGNTAADYFCFSLEKLSSLLKLPPTVAGVTLLPLGNGAPDVFASIAAFVGTDAGEVGLNSVLGGALFVTCVVVGTVSLCVAEQRVRINKRCFITDVCFLLFTLLSLLVILIVGELSVAGAVAFISIYVLYAFFVAANEVLKKYAHGLGLNPVTRLLLPVKSCAPSVGNVEDESSIHASLLQFGAENEVDVPLHETRLPHWILAANVAIYSNETVREESPKPLWGWNDDETPNDHPPSSPCSKLCAVLEMPLALPRRLTIPVVDEERWSKGYAVASAFLAPMFLAFLWNTRDGVGTQSGEIAYVIGASAGGVLGVLAIIYTIAEHPPEKFLFPWVLGGFFMSIIWFYIVATELVALLATLALIFGIPPSILGLTVLAWGNSMGDLTSNLALATNGRDGVQIAMSGCYAGPVFNTLVGLGISMLIGAWSNRPALYVIPKDQSLYFTIGFLVLALVWSLIVLPRKDMSPSKVLGVGLVIIYVAFLYFRLSIAMGALSLDDL